MLQRLARAHVLRFPAAHRCLSSARAWRQAVASPTPPPPASSLVPFSSRTEAPTDDAVPADDPRVAGRQTEFLISNLPGRVATAQAAARRAAVIAENRAAAASYEGALAHMLLVHKDCTAEDYCNPWRWAHKTYPNAVPRPPPAYEPSPAELAHAARVASSRFAATSSSGEEEEGDAALAGLEASSSSSDDEVEAAQSGMLDGFLKHALPEVEALERDMRTLVDSTEVGARRRRWGFISLAFHRSHHPSLPLISRTTSWRSCTRRARRSTTLPSPRATAPPPKCPRRQLRRLLLPRRPCPQRLLAAASCLACTSRARSRRPCVRWRGRARRRGPHDPLSPPIV